MAAIVIIVLAAGGYYYWQMQDATPEPIVTTPVEQVPSTSTYATSTFSVTYPNTFTIDSSYAYEQFAGKPIHGVKFTIPQSIATSTNLSSDTYVSVETLPRANSCSGDIYLLENVRSQTVSDAGVTYSVASSTGAGAGNIYEEIVYALPNSKPCTAIRYYIHSTQIANYPEGTVTEFNRAALLEAFDQIRRSVTIAGQATTSVQMGQ